QGLAIAERAYQHARDYARSRRQGRAAAGDKAAVPIIRHPDVRRLLMTMRAHVEAMRGLAYAAAAALDRARLAPDEAERARWQARLDLLIPIVKAWCTDVGSEVASLGIQVHGGMGFIEETGAAQHYRDARIGAIYEGTNGIQANDLVGRKVLRDGGAAAAALIAEMRQASEAMAAAPGDDVAVIRSRRGGGVDALARATEGLVEVDPAASDQALAGATPYLRLCGTVAGGALLARAAAIAAERLRHRPDDAPFLAAKLATARFYADNILPLAGGWAEMVTSGAPSTL